VGINVAHGVEISKDLASDLDGDLTEQVKLNA
jgi:hypothetical protein